MNTVETKETDYQIAKVLPYSMNLYDSKEIDVANIEAFRRYLTPIAKSAGAEFSTKKISEGKIRVLRIK
jgi:hypothetical protein